MLFKKSLWDGGSVPTKTTHCKLPLLDGLFGLIKYFQLVSKIYFYSKITEMFTLYEKQI